VARGLAQTQLTKNSNLHRTFIGSVERGERNVSVLTLRLIVRVLQARLADSFAYAPRNGRPSR
jgi:transcriptional regulator with XRE-family HTH domain